MSILFIFLCSLIIDSSMESYFYGPIINLDKSIEQSMIAKRFCSRKQYDAIYFDGKFMKAIESKQISRKESWLWDIGDREIIMLIYKFQKNMITGQYYWRLENTFDAVYSRRAKEWKNFMIIGGIYLKHKNVLIEIFRYNRFDLKLDPAKMNGKIFRYVVYFNINENFTSEYDSIGKNQIEKFLLNTNEKIPYLYGLSVQGELSNENNTKDDQWFFPKEIVKYMIGIEKTYDSYEVAGQNYAFVSINEFEIYYFFVRILDRITNKLYWRAYGYKYEEKLGKWDPGFEMDGKKFQIIGSFEYNYQTFIFIYDNEHNNSFGLEIFFVMPLNISVKPIYLQQIVCDSKQFYNFEWKKTQNRIIITLLTILIPTMTIYSVYCCNRYQSFLRHGFLLSTILGRKGLEDLNVIRLNNDKDDDGDDDDMIRNVPSRYILKHKQSKYLNIREKIEDEKALYLEIKRLGRKIIYEK